jgi:hypothetical protein
VVWQQTTESFIRCLENAFRYFGGVPRTLIIDNLRAAVTRADWYDPELNAKVAEFCRHYGTVMLPTRPAMPHHKGKIEAGVKFAQNNALKGRSFTSLSAQNLFLLDWESGVADTRIHGTTRQQIGKVFNEVERAKLLSLPAGLFPVFEEAPRTVHRDGYVELQRAYYSVPPEYVGRQVWVRWESRLLRVFNQRREVIAVHALAEPGKFTTDPNHLHSPHRRVIQQGLDHLLDRTRLIGVHKHVHWQRRQLEFPGGKKGGGNQEAGEPRFIDFFGKLENHLKDMYQRRDSKSPFLFPSDDDPLKHVVTFKQIWKKVRIAAKIWGTPQDIGFHHFKHYFISHCVMAGMDFMTIAIWAAHMDGGVLIGKVYGHLRPGHSANEAKKLELAAAAWD